ncbi:hypothetical protein BDP27DRAFT_1339870 [Rhodocollybia butyracea]|uniref:Uncharacterized protein n=1 Tax=Rhodocollybia butyracea TaxID=206335 RepID=A0A9P5P549_9AGAR|nr:hypothetical protein BDP27DRAFT_1342306 [Rhodocollybia butyracea]KAF9060307.1 hypothetical protein BDP27DRAFT_1339870 [Rhodocollybia butyracea]
MARWTKWYSTVMGCVGDCLGFGARYMCCNRSRLGSRHMRIAACLNLVAPDDYGSSQLLGQPQMISDENSHCVPDVLEFSTHMRIMKVHLDIIWYRIHLP